ncbi:MAG: CHAT domain-containing protein [Acidobacteria bacterium]|nr:CHAT domain-containing protein [Acidobacteriota bacterium]
MLTLGFIAVTGKSIFAATISETALPAGAQNAAEAPPEVRPIAVGNTVEREIAALVSHTYRLHCEAKALLRVSIERPNNTLSTIVLTPDNKRLLEIARATTKQNVETVTVIIDTADEYQIQVKQLNKDAPTGSYKLTVEELRPATAKELGQKLLVQADQYRFQNSAEARQKAIENYQAALQVFQNEGDFVWQARALRGLAFTYRNDREHGKELDALKQALSAARQTAETRLQIALLNDQGFTYSAAADMTNALASFNEALTLSRNSKNTQGEADSLSNIARLYLAFDQLEKAVESANQAIQVWRAMAEVRGEGIERYRSGSLFRERYPQIAMGYYEQALPLLRQANERGREADTLNDMGLIYRIWGQSQKAFDAYNKTIEIDNAINTPLNNRISTLNNLGLVYVYLGDPKSGLERHKKALEFAEATQNLRAKGFSLHNMGLAYKLLNDPAKATETLEQALQIRTELKDPGQLCSTLSVLGLVYLETGNAPKSIETEKQAIAVCQTSDRRVGGQANAALGKAYYEQKEYDQAIEFAKRALVVAKDFRDRAAEIDALCLMAFTQEKQGKLQDARTQIEDAIKVIESLRVSVLQPELRASWLAFAQEAYKLHLDILMKLHEQQPNGEFAALALQANESGLARSLLEALTENRANIRQGVEPELLERETALQKRFNEKAGQLTNALLAGRNETEIAKLRQEINILTTAYQQVQAQIRATSPRYAALTQPQPLTLKEIQTQVLDADTMLLEYSLGPERSYLWAVSADAITSFVLPKADEIEAQARTVYKLLTTRNDYKKGETAEQKAARIKQADAAYPQAAAALGRMLLSPVASLLGKKRLLIVADGALQYIPFAALPLPQSKKKFTPLVVHHEIVSLPSASTMAVLRRDIKGRKPAEKSLAVVADPVFDKQDERVARSAPTTATTGGTRSESEDANRLLERVDEEDGPPETKLLRRIKRLPYTRQEADGITHLVPENERLELLDFEASREAALSPLMSQYRYVHFASHGYINTEQPMLSAIVLSLIDKQGNPQPQGGFLRTIDVFNLNLPADLVVLSACETGLGKAIRGEGLVGLTRGFMYAGAARVVVSLWSVSDRATADLMERFYRRIFKKDLTPSAALRSAQVRMSEKKKWSAPYYWAAFIMQGEWR